jgi:peptidoglycan/LPS O-acetylase OafA/YrhL
MSVIKYRPEVDGLRTVAVIPVVLFHLGLPWLPGGFVGVDVFFVISGYLISSIILKEQAADTFTFSGFWMRRIRRILPAMLAMLIATSLAGYFILWGPSWKGLGDQVIAAIGIYANFEMWQLSGGYWGPAAENAPLLHTWSLSVEEQFYLFYPLLLLTLLKFTPKRVFPLILAGSIFSFGIGVYATTHHPNVAFYFLPTRAWELAAGCLLAIFERSRGPAPKGNISRTLAFTGLFLIGAGYCLTKGADDFPGFWALLPVIGTVLVIRFSGGEKCLAGGLLSWAPVVYIGKCSYSLYLWHWPVIVLGAALKLKYPELVNLGTIIVMITLLTLASYYFIEKPTRKMTRILPAVICALIVSIGLAIFLLRADYKYDFSRFAPVQSFNPSYDLAPVRTKAGGSGMSGIIMEKRPPELLEAYKDSGVVKRYGADLPEIVVLGSSHGLMWSKVIDEVAEELGRSISFFTARATVPLIEFPIKEKATTFFTVGEKRVFDHNRLAQLKAWRPKLVIIIDRWSIRENIEAYPAMLEYIKDCGAHVLFVEQPPEIEIGDTTAPLFVAYLCEGLEEGMPEQTFLEGHQLDEVVEGNEQLERLAASYPYVDVLSVHDLFPIHGNQVLVRDQDQILYLDRDHISYNGALRAKGRLKVKIKAILDE